MTEIEIYALKIEALESDLFNKLLTCINAEKRMRIKKYRRMKDKYEALLSELLIRYIIIKKLNICNYSIKFNKGEFGKPFLENISDFYFNISHSVEWIICAIDMENIGVDIEKIRNIKYKEVAQNFFSEGEYRFIFSNGEKEEQNNFFRVWTLKESYIKACGKGFAIPLKDFGIDINSKNISLEKKDNDSDYYFKEIPIDISYKSSICTVKPKRNLNTIFISQEKLISMFGF